MALTLHYSPFSLFHDSSAFIPSFPAHPSSPSPPHLSVFHLSPLNILSSLPMVMDDGTSTWQQQPESWPQSLLSFGSFSYSSLLTEGWRGEIGAVPRGQSSEGNLAVFQHICLHEKCVIRLLNSFITRLSGIQFDVNGGILLSFIMTLKLYMKAFFSCSPSFTGVVLCPVWGVKYYLTNNYDSQPNILYLQYKSLFTNHTVQALTQHRFQMFYPFIYTTAFWRTEKANF